MLPLLFLLSCNDKSSADSAEPTENQLDTADTSLADTNDSSVENTDTATPDSNNILLIIADDLGAGNSQC